MDDSNIDSLITLSILSIICIGISIILLVNNKLKISNQNFITDKNAYYINLYNRITLTIIFIIFLIINYNYYKDALKRNEDTTQYKLQIYSSFFIVLAAIISLYVAYNNKNNINFENPDI